MCTLVPDASVPIRLSGPSDPLADKYAAEYGGVFIVSRKPLARRVVQKSLGDEQKTQKKIHAVSRNYVRRIDEEKLFVSIKTIYELNVRGKKK